MASLSPRPQPGSPPLATNSSRSRRHLDEGRRRSRSPPRGGDHRRRDRDAKPEHRDSSHRHGGHHYHHRSRHRGGDNEEKSRHHHHHGHSRRKHAAATSAAVADEPKDLPFGARKLSARSDFTAFEPLFAHYLELHKDLNIFDLDDTEVRGRWKSFVGKWNRGELAAGWYEPEIFQRVTAEWAAEEAFNPAPKRKTNEVATRDSLEHEEEGDNDYKTEKRKEQQQQQPQGDEGCDDGDDDDDDDDDFGPPLPPGQQAHQPSSSSRKGPDIPKLQDLALRRELDAEERAAELEELRDRRKADRRLQKEQLEELVPRADPGSRERKLEKRQAVNEKMRAFRDPSPGVGEVEEKDLLGGGDGIEEHRKLLALGQQKVSQRQSRREEEQRAKTAERDERIQAYRAKEEKTIETLKELARRRFG
ncbi:hypothetical protein B0H63DRAFT_209752 [Podospora didyma]|uniref:Uncharacterized protein n=1 Tax=Podospora didyma TaxID=330526 RepID=A0AAE0TW06_9PEZI|nr:hypothetical protein B0H63DRAFT_209752 [Podospora didyma]